MSDIDRIQAHKIAYIKYRGGSIDSEGNILFAKDDAMAYAEGLEDAIRIIKGEDIELQ
jgi:hypothetical protein